ncbi:MAG: Holliday junction resolvase RuvX [Bacilli bacterium]
MRILGLDLGTKTLGLAISDNTQTIATSLGTIRFEENKNELVLDELRKVIDEYDAKTLVLGLPKNMNNSIGYAAERSLLFKELLVKTFNLKVELQDERLSSVSANNILLQADVSRKKRKAKVDQVAATVILQNYLDIKKGI